MLFNYMIQKAVRSALSRPQVTYAGSRYFVFLVSLSAVYWSSGFEGLCWNVTRRGCTSTNLGHFYVSYPVSVNVVVTQVLLRFH